MAGESRTPRELATRESTKRRWAPASLLPTPNPEPGYSFRYIRNRTMGQADPTNVGQALREGWEPVKASDYPELQVTGNSDGNVEIGGLMLCKIPKEMMDQRAEYYYEQTQQQTRGVESQYKQVADSNNRYGGSINESKSTVSRGSAFGNGN